MRITKLFEGWYEADWHDVNNQEIIYRFPKGVQNSHIVIKVAAHYANKPIHYRTNVKSIHWNVFRYKVSRSAVSSALGKLRDLGILKKSETMRGKNTQWIKIKDFGSTGENECHE